MSVKRRLNKLEDVSGPRPDNFMVIIEYPDKRLYDTGSRCYVTQEAISMRNPEVIVWMPDNGREAQP